MQALCAEVRKLVSACEAVHSLLAQGGWLTADERGVLTASLLELLEVVERVSMRSDARGQSHRDSQGSDTVSLHPLGS